MFFVHLQYFSFLVISTNDALADYQGNMLGIYQQQGQYNGAPYYRQLHSPLNSSIREATIKIKKTEMFYRGLVIFRIFKCSYISVRN